MAPRPPGHSPLPRVSQKHVLKTCLLKIQEISDNRMENKLIVTYFQGVYDAPGRSGGCLTGVSGFSSEVGTAVTPTPGERTLRPRGRYLGPRPDQ